MGFFKSKSGKLMKGTGEKLVIPGCNGGGISTLFPTSNNIVNEEIDMTIEGTPITITNIDLVNRVITLSWLPNISTLFTPVSGKEWMLGIGIGGEPNVFGQDAAYLKVLTGDYNSKTLTYSASYQRNISNFVVGARIYFCNIYHNGWDINVSIQLSAGTYYSGQLIPVHVYHHSTAGYKMIVNGYNGSVWGLGLFSSTNLASWTPDSSTAKLISQGTPGWVAGNSVRMSSVIPHPTILGRFFALFFATVSTVNKVGWMTFDENLENITYSAAPILSSTGLLTGHTSPSIVYFNGKYRIGACARTTSTLHTWQLKEYESDYLEGPYTFARDILDCTSVALANLKTSWRSSHTDIVYLFKDKCELYAIIGGTSNWNASSTRGERVFGMAHFDKVTQSWYDLNKGVAVGLSQFSTAFWGVAPNGHMGSYPIILERNGVFHFYASCTQATNAYVIFGGTKTI